MTFAANFMNAFSVRRCFTLSVFTMLGLTLGGCAVFAPTPRAGDTQEHLESTYGHPTFTVAQGNDALMVYNEGSFGQETFIARIGPDHTVLSWEQVLTTENFARIKPGSWNQDDVIRLIGHPYEITRYGRTPGIAWNYGSREGGVWNSMMTVYFDDKGIVMRLENGADPRFEKAFGGI